MFGFDQTPTKSCSHACLGLHGSAVVGALTPKRDTAGSENGRMSIFMINVGHFGELFCVVMNVLGIIDLIKELIYISTE